MDPGPVRHWFRQSRKAMSPTGKLAAAGLAIQALLLLALLLLRHDESWVMAEAALLAVATGAVLGIAVSRRQQRPAVQQLTHLRQEVETLQDARQAAQSANETKSRYLSHVSHEIRSPLNAIYGYAQLVEQDAGINPQEAAKIIRRCAEHMTGLVESLLDISKLENGMLRIESAPVRLGPFIEHLASMMMPAASSKGLRFEVELPRRMPDVVRMDESRLRQVLVNLLSNAIKFTRQGSVRLKLDYRGEIATFSVIDTGPGIAAENLERIFMPFDRAGALTEPGVGLGLPISRAITEMLGGEIAVDSEPGQGSRFTVKLMLAEVVLGGAPVPAQPGTSHYAGPSRAILVVDDDAEQRAFIDHFLTGCGFEVVAVHDGRTGQMIADGRHFDLALLDINMPGLSGWETARRLRARHGKAMRLVMLSANSGESGVEPGAEPVHDHFLAKPVRLDQLAATIGTLLGLDLAARAEVPGTVAGPCIGRAAVMPSEGQVHVQRMRELLRIGYVRGIETELHALARLLPSDSVLIRDLYDSLDRFDMTVMRRLLEGL